MVVVVVVVVVVVDDDDDVDVFVATNDDHHYCRKSHVYIAVPAVRCYRLGLSKVWLWWSIGMENCGTPTLWLCRNSYGKWSFIVDFPLKMVIFHSYVKLPEGTGKGGFDQHKVIL